MNGPADDEAFIREVRRVHERYAVEVIERYDICPFARHARLAGEVDRPVLLQCNNDVAPTLAVLDALEADPRRVPVAIAVYPRLSLDPRAFDEFAARVRQADQVRHGGKPVYVSATFHPDYPLDRRSPASLVPYFRRSPDPCLQLVRLSVIEEARGATHGTFVFDFSPGGFQELNRRLRAPSLSDRIALDNQATLEREGAAVLDALFREIRDDRDRSYARFA